MKKTTAYQIFLAISATLTWSAVILQFYLIILNRVASVAETIIRFFSFYTILTNILVALSLTVLLLKPNSRWFTFFSRANVLLAITIYITVVGTLYNLILRQLWSPEGLQRIADELLHVVTPILFIVYWFVFAPKERLPWKSAFQWLIYPFVYAFCVLCRGAWSGFYPYPFIDVKTLGYRMVLINCVGLCIAFFLLSLLFIAIAKAMNRNAHSAAKKT